MNSYNRSTFQHVTIRQQISDIDPEVVALQHFLNKETNQGEKANQPSFQQ